VYPSRDCDYYECADYSGAYDRHPLFLDKAEATHKPYTGGDEEEAEVLYQEVGYFVDPEYAHNA